MSNIPKMGHLTTPELYTPLVIKYALLENPSSSTFFPLFSHHEMDKSQDIRYFSPWLSYLFGWITMVFPMVFPISGGREIATFDDLTVFQSSGEQRPWCRMDWPGHGKNIGKYGEKSTIFMEVWMGKYHLGILGIFLSDVPLPCLISKRCHNVVPTKEIGHFSSY